MSQVYEPDDDSYLLVDCLDAEMDWIRSRLNPFFCAEIGSGSGFVIEHLSRSLGPERLYCATDINIHALRATREKEASSKQLVLGCLAKSKFLQGFRGKCFDLILFNPPYVETELEEITQSSNDSIVKAYAGGPKGTVIIKEFLELLMNYLNPCGGVLYLVLYSRNEPELLLSQWVSGKPNVTFRKVGQKSTSLEHLSVYKISNILF